MDQINADAKKKELLPDILSHQDRLRKRAEILRDSIKKLENEWAIDVSKTRLERAETPDPQPHDRKFSTVDSIYGGMSILEDEFDSLGARLSILCGQYLGETKR